MGNIDTSTPLYAAINDYRHWLSKHVLPLWSTKGIDEFGASFERLLANGEPDHKANKRVRVQARQMFSFAYGQHHGWLDNGLELIAGIDEFVEQYAKNHQDGGFAHVLSPNNQIINHDIDLYDCAFFLLAYGWRYHVFNDLKALNKADQLLLKIDKDLKDNPGGWSEGGYISAYRRQNPHMHMFEACLTLYQVTKNGKWLAKAGEMFCLFETRFYDHKQGLLLEYFDDAWQPVTKDNEYIVEPGHMMEWVWLLRQYQQATGTPVDDYCHKLYHNALEFGLDRRTNTLVDEVSIDGRILKDTQRCWPMTEWDKSQPGAVYSHPKPALQLRQRCH